jgi:polyketide synthase PksN
LETSGRGTKVVAGPVYLFAALDPSGMPWFALNAAGLADALIALPPADDAAGWVEQSVMTLFRHCQALVREKTTVTKRIVVCVPYHGSEYPYRSLMGLLRSLSLESHFLQTKLIFHAGLDSAASAAFIGQLRAEIQNWDGHSEILYTSDGIRQVLGQEVVSLPAPSPAALRQGGVYWITGGLGGLGRLFASRLGKAANARIILSGRSPLNDATQSRLEALRSGGLNINYIPCDFSSQSAVEATVKRIRREFGALHGVIHSAGLILDNYLANKTEDEIRQVLMAKVRATQWLDECTRFVPLDFFAVFSSIASFGGVGQLDYAAGNAFLDALARERNGRVAKGVRSGRTISFNWPLWKEGGMTPGKYYEEHIQHHLGMVPLESSIGFDTFLSALSSNEDQIGVAVGDAKKIFSFLRIRDAAETMSKALVKPVEDLIVLSSVSNRDVDEVVCDALVKVLGVAKSSIQRERELTDYGADSVMLTELANHLNSAFGVELQGSAFFELNSPQRIMDHLRSVEPVVAPVGLEVPLGIRASPGDMAPVFSGRVSQARVDLTDLEDSPSELSATVEPDEKVLLPKFATGAVAIVGFDCHFPDAADPDQFWENIVNKVVSTRKISNQEWLERGVVLGDEKDYEAMRWAALMPGIARFDAKFWGVEEADAAVMDPQLRLLLRSIWRCVEHSGQAWEPFTRQRVGLFVASDSVDYRSVLKQGNRQAGLNSGLSSGMLANRASYICDFRGPSESVDTACSSVYVAINRAIQALSCGQCEAAVVGGVKALLDPAEFQIRDHGQLLSHSGRLSSFDAKADGYVRGEGVGCVLIKTLEAAHRDGDVIHAVITGMGVSHNGRGSLSPLAPDVDAQCQAMGDAYRMAGIGPETIGYIEANGASTAFSDAAEMAAYRKFFKDALGADRYRKHRVAISAVKPNLGHMEAASGMASLLKAVLALSRKQIPPTAHFEKAHASMFLNNSPFHIPIAPLDWPSPTGADGSSHPRRVALHAIGIGGVNAHLVLEESCDVRSQGSVSLQMPKDGSVLFVLSAKSPTALAASCDRWCRYLEMSPGPIGNETLTLPALADYSRWCREAMPYRLALVVPDMAALIAQLRAGIVAAKDGLDVLGYRTLGVVRPAARKTGLAYDPNQTHGETELRDLAEKWVKGEVSSWEPPTMGTLRLSSAPSYPFDDLDFWCVERVVATAPLDNRRLKP